MVFMEKRGDFYMSWHEDARDIAKALGLVVTKSGGADTVGIPAHALDERVTSLNKLGISVKINGHLSALANNT
jgi:DNA mismatch repair ATPase MutS